MKKLSVVSVMLFLILGFAGCGAKKVDTENLKEVATHVGRQRHRRAPEQHR